MDRQYLVRDDHIGIFKNFMSDQLIEDYKNYFNLDPNFSKNNEAKRS